MNPHLSLHDVEDSLKRTGSKPRDSKTFLLTENKNEIFDLIIFHIRGV